CYVTGVQTCALPIYPVSVTPTGALKDDVMLNDGCKGAPGPGSPQERESRNLSAAQEAVSEVKGSTSGTPISARTARAWVSSCPRSEERRVGKEASGR